MERVPRSGTGEEHLIFHLRGSSRRTHRRHAFLRRSVVAGGIRCPSLSGTGFWLTRWDGEATTALVTSGTTGQPEGPPEQVDRF